VGVLRQPATAMKQRVADSLTPLWQQYHQRLLRYIRKHLAVPDEAQDVVQTIFMKVYQHPPAPMSPEQLEAWLWRVTKNTLIDHWRKQNKVPPLLSMDADDQGADWLDTQAAKASGVDANPRLQMSCCLEAMVQHLPDKYRQTIELADLQQHPYREVAQQLGVTESAIKSRVKRGREKLRDQLVACCGGDCHCADPANTDACCHEPEASSSV
jgi:RNA polymerase sigma-70 factor, ECF subfamily